MFIYDTNKVTSAVATTLTSFADRLYTNRIVLNDTKVKEHLCPIFTRAREIAIIDYNSRRFISEESYPSLAQSNLQFETNFRTLNKLAEVYFPGVTKDPDIAAAIHNCDAAFAGKIEITFVEEFIELLREQTNNGKLLVNINAAY